MIPEDPTDEQIQALVAACPPARMFEETDLPEGFHRLHVVGFYEMALHAARRSYDRETR